MKFLYAAGADAIFAVHMLVVTFVLFGWFFSTQWIVYLYLGILIATFVLDVLFGYCVLSKWEFQLRKKVHPSLRYDYAWATFYTYKITNRRISDRLYGRTALIALILLIGGETYFRLLF